MPEVTSDVPEQTKGIGSPFMSSADITDIEGALRRRRAFVDEFKIVPVARTVDSLGAPHTSTSLRSEVQAIALLPQSVKESPSRPTQTSSADGLPVLELQLAVAFDESICLMSLEAPSDEGESWRVPLMNIWLKLSL